MQTHQELTSALYPRSQMIEVFSSFTSLSVCQRRCEIVSSRRLQSVCRVGCLKVVLHTQHLLHHILMLSNDTQSTQNKESSLISDKNVVLLVLLRFNMVWFLIREKNPWATEVTLATSFGPDRTNQVDSFEHWHPVTPLNKAEHTSVKSDLKANLGKNALASGLSTGGHWVGQAPCQRVAWRALQRRPAEHSLVGRACCSVCFWL